MYFQAGGTWDITPLRLSCRGFERETLTKEDLQLKEIKMNLKNLNNDKIMAKKMSSMH